MPTIKKTATAKKNVTAKKATAIKTPVKKTAKTGPQKLSDKDRLFSFFQWRHLN